jgi:hypothetical protein
MLRRTGALSNAERCYRRARKMSSLEAERRLLTRLIDEVAQLRAAKPSDVAPEERDP